jgi:glycosyltransferase involved in cell wall biosynthesis
MPGWLGQLTQLEPIVHPTPNTPSARLNWEQRILLQRLQQLNAKLLHLTTANPILIGKPYCVLSPAFYPVKDSYATDFPSRIRTAIGQGGIARLRGTFWPQDIPLPKQGTSVYPLPPIVHPSFKAVTELERNSPQDLDLPETYVLYHGPYGDHSLRTLLDAWSWAAGPIGQLYPLVFLGVKQEERKRLAHTLKTNNLKDEALILPPLPVDRVPDVFQNCVLLFHPGPTPVWGSPIRHAFACGKPVVTTRNHISEPMVGPAAFVIPPGDTRKLGAALITTVVEEKIAEQLSQAAREQATRWHSAGFQEQLLRAYQDILGR